MGKKVISGRHLRLAGYRSILRKRFREAGLLPNDGQRKSPLYQQFQSIREQLRGGALDFAELGLMKLKWTWDRLVEIRAVDQKVAKDFVRRLKTHRLDDYVGTLCEMNVTSVLIRNGLAFSRPDPPDFQITVGAGLANIECTSVHVETNSGKELSYKIGASINDKKQKPYCNESTALVIDFTNVMYHSHVSGWNMTPEELKEQFENLALECGFGAILLQCQAGDLSGQRVTLKLLYMRLAGKNPSVELKTVLDQCFPRGDYAVTKAVFPRMG